MRFAMSSAVVCLALVAGSGAVGAQTAKSAAARATQEGVSTSNQPAGFYLDGGGRIETSTRQFQNSAGTARALPYAAIGHGDSFSANTRDGAWLRALQFGNVGLGPALNFDRHVAVPGKGSPRITDMFGSAKVGAFLDYREAGLEWGRITVTSGAQFLGSAPGFDIRATKRFNLSEGLSLNFGPTLAFADSRDYGLRQISLNPPVMAATGALLQIEKELAANLKATLTANYAVLHPPQNAAAPLPGGRNRFDFGLTLSTRLFGQ